LTAQYFDDSLQTLRSQSPFRPSSVELLSGDRFEVDYSDTLVVREGIAAFIAPRGVPRIFDYESVSQLIADTQGE